MKKSDSKNILKVYGLGKKIDHVERKHITNNIEMIGKYKVLVSNVKGISH